MKRGFTRDYFQIYMKLLLFLSVALVPFSHSADMRYHIPIEGSPSVGPIDAALTIVEFLDYQ